MNEEQKSLIEQLKQKNESMAEQMDHMRKEVRIMIGKKRVK